VQSRIDKVNQLKRNGDGTSFSLGAKPGQFKYFVKYSITQQHDAAKAEEFSTALQLFLRELIRTEQHQKGK
jgi:hypothetical protein